MKKYLSIELHDYLSKRDKYKGLDYWDISLRSSVIADKHKTLKENIEEYWDTKPVKLNDNDIVEEIEKLFKFVEKFPLKKNAYRPNDGEAYGGYIQKSQVEQVRYWIHNNIYLFNREINFKHCAVTYFHRLESFLNGDRNYKQHLYRKRKLKQEDWWYINDLIRFFYERVEALEVRKEYFKVRRAFKKSKKKVFVFRVQSNGYRWSLDWYVGCSNDFNIVCSHTSVEDAMQSLFRYNNGKFKDYIIQDLSKERISCLEEKQVQIDQLEATKENIDKAKQNMQERWFGRYNSWGSFFMSLIKDNA